MISSKELILLAAKASHLAYAGVEAEFKALGFHEVHPLHDAATDTQGYVLVNDELVLVVFRGTESIKDWMTDVKVKKQVTNHPYYIGNFAVHRGFLAAFNGIVEQLRDLKHETDVFRGYREVAFTGHSLGGALAMIAAMTFDNTVSNVITFGQPRVGNGAFAEMYRKLLGSKTTRIVNGLDAVTLMPPWLLGYRHVKGHVVFIDASGKVLIDPHWTTRVMSHAWCVIKDWLHIRWVNLGGFKVPLPFRLSAVRNHSMRDYLNALEGWKE